MFGTFEFFPNLAPEILEEHRHWLEPNFLDPASQKFILCVQSYIVRTPHHTILIDTCIGCGKSSDWHAPWYNRSDTVWLGFAIARSMLAGTLD